MTKKPKKNISTSSTDQYCISCSTGNCLGNFLDFSCAGCTFDPNNTFCFSCNGDTSLAKCQSDISDASKGCTCFTQKASWKETK